MGWGGGGTATLPHNRPHGPHPTTDRVHGRVLHWQHCSIGWQMAHSHLQLPPWLHLTKTPSYKFQHKGGTGLPQAHTAQGKGVEGIKVATKRDDISDSRALERQTGQATTSPTLSATQQSSIYMQ